MLSLSDSTLINAQRVYKTVKFDISGGKRKLIIGLTRPLLRCVNDFDEVIKLTGLDGANTPIEAVQSGLFRIVTLFDDITLSIYSLPTQKIRVEKLIFAQKKIQSILDINQLNHLAEVVMMIWSDKDHYPEQTKSNDKNIKTMDHESISEDDPILKMVREATKIAKVENERSDKVMREVNILKICSMLGCNPAELTNYTTKDIRRMHEFAEHERVLSMGTVQADPKYFASLPLVDQTRVG